MKSVDAATEIITMMTGYPPDPAQDIRLVAGITAILDAYRDGALDEAAEIFEQVFDRHGAKRILALKAALKGTT